MNNAILNLYHFEPHITTLGPGNRAGVWLQGCDRNCPGCLVPESWPPTGGDIWQVDTLVSKISAQTDIEGVSISGGEPFLQAAELCALLVKLKDKRPDLSVMLFTGFHLKELQSPVEKEIIQHLDILVDGPFEIKQQIVDPWRGSENQQIHFLSSRYNVENHQQAAPGIEFFIRTGGRIFLSGIPQQGLLEKLEESIAANFELHNAG